jgi:hypothetical protein
VMRAGFKIALVNDVFIHHYGSATFRKMDIDYEAIMRENFEVFSAKWGTTHQIHEHFNAVELAQSEAWMNARDYIEPNYSKVFHPQCPAMKIEGNPAARFLCVPDWDNPSWMGVVLSYIENTPTGNSTALVLRVEPCTQQRIEAIIDQIGKLFAAQNINPETIPDIVLETTPIHSGDRGSLYTACDVLIPCEGSRAHIYLREAKACGLAIAGENTPSSKSDKQQEDAVLV